MSLLERVAESRWGTRVMHHFPPGQFGKFLALGVWNTLFAYGSYAALTALFMPHFAYGYMLASVVASPVNITVSYLGYKWVVFKTRGNYLREWSRSIVVYGTRIAISVCLLPVVVFLVRWITGLDRAAPYIAGALMMSTNSFYSFLAHKRFTFQPAKEANG